MFDLNNQNVVKMSHNFFSGQVPEHFDHNPSLQRLQKYTTWRMYGFIGPPDTGIRVIWPKSTEKVRNSDWKKRRTRKIPSNTTMYLRRSHNFFTSSGLKFTPVIEFICRLMRSPIQILAFLNWMPELGINSIVSAKEFCMESFAMADCGWIRRRV